MKSYILATLLVLVTPALAEDLPTACNSLIESRVSEDFVYLGRGGYALAVYPREKDIQTSENDTAPGVRYRGLDAEITSKGGEIALELSGVVRTLPDGSCTLINLDDCRE